MTKIVRKNFPAKPMTAARKRRFEKLAQMPDSEIDFSDIPELTEKFWKNAVRNPYYRPIKKQLTSAVGCRCDRLAPLRLARLPARLYRLNRGLPSL